MPTVMITGANRGLGLEFTRQYAADDWRVLAACRNPETADQLKAVSGDIEIVKLDVTDTDSVKAAAAAVVGQPIDILLNVAGIIGRSGLDGQTLGEIDYPGWLEVFDTNTLGPVRVSEALVDEVAASERRLIVTITSGMGSIDDNTSGGIYAYRTSKAAVNMAMRSLSVDLKDRGISCVVLNPGWVKTDMGGDNAELTPEQSITALRGIIDKLGMTETGQFYNYDGKVYPW